MAIAGNCLINTTAEYVNNMPINGPDSFGLTRDFMTMRSIGVMQQFTRGDKREARAARFDREAEAAQAGRAYALANLQRETALAWLDRCYQGRMRDADRATRRSAAAGRGGRYILPRRSRFTGRCVLGARMVVAQLDDRIVQADRLVATAINRLARWVGDAAEPAAGCRAEYGCFQRRLGQTRRPRLAPPPARIAVAAGTSRARRGRERAGEQALRLERRVDVQPARGPAYRT